MINFSTALLTLFVLISAPVAAWNLLAPPSLCWLSVWRATVIGLAASFLLLLLAGMDANRQNAAKTPKAGKPTNSPQNR